MFSSAHCARCAVAHRQGPLTVRLSNQHQYELHVMLITTILTAVLLQGLQREGDRVVDATLQDCKEDLEQQMTLPVSATNGHSVDRGHYDRFCHGSRGINWIHMKSWILASTNSSGKSAKPMSLQGSLRAMINCYTCTGENNSFNWVPTGNYYNTGGSRNFSQQCQALAFHSERQGNCKLMGHDFGP
jgi:hypothetical protein